MPQPLHDVPQQLLLDLHLLGDVVAVHVLGSAQEVRSEEGRGGSGGKASTSSGRRACPDQFTVTRPCLVCKRQDGLPFVGQTGEGEVFSGSALRLGDGPSGTQAAADFYRLVGLTEAGDRGPSCHQDILTGVVLVKLA